MYALSSKQILSAGSYSTQQIRLKSENFIQYLASVENKLNYNLAFNNNSCMLVVMVMPSD